MESKFIKQIEWTGKRPTIENYNSIFDFFKSPINSIQKDWKEQKDIASTKEEEELVVILDCAPLLSTLRELEHCFRYASVNWLKIFQEKERFKILWRKLCLIFREWCL